MSKYGKIARSAAKKARNGVDPRKAWKISAKKIYPRPDQKESRKKGCPRNAFLGLAEDGVIVGIPFGDYTNSIKSKMYALAGVKLLRKKPHLSNNPSKLWRCVMRKLNTRKVHNNQMDVVVALWENSDIERNA